MDSGHILKTLNEFALDNADLERIEDMLSDVNVFEAIGQVRSEEHHSQFLSFLLDPRQGHGLGDIFLKRFLQRALSEAAPNQAPILPIDLDVWDLDDTLVWRERYNIDILLVNEDQRFAVVIENKTFSAEHSNQLQRYRTLIEGQYADFRIVCLFLTIDGDKPSDSRYISITYEVVCGILEQILARRAASLGPDTSVLLHHYVRMLRRHFMEESELTELARRIYKRHRIALDFIFEQRLDLQAQVADLLRQLINSNSDLVEDHSTKSAVRFALKQWDEIAALTNSKGWTPTGRLLLFEFKNGSQSVSLALIIGPGDQAVRERIFRIATENKGVFNPSYAQLYPTWSRIWTRSFLGRRDLEESEWDDTAKKIEKGWATFIGSDLPKLTKAIRDELASF